MAKKDPQSDLLEMVQRMQAPFMGNVASGAPMEKFLEMQSGLLKEAETFSRHWFERRNEAIETAIEAMHQMNSNGAARPAEALRVMADWQRGSLERLGADAQEWTELCMRSAAVATTPQVDDTPAGSEKPKASKAEADKPKASKAEAEKTKADKADAKPTAGHATPV